MAFRTCIDKYAPDTAKMALAIAYAMRDKCHACSQCKTERTLGVNLHVPDTDKDACKECLSVIERTIFGGE